MRVCVCVHACVYLIVMQSLSGRLCYFLQTKAQLHVSLQILSDILVIVFAVRSGEFTSRASRLASLQSAVRLFSQ